VRGLSLPERVARALVPAAFATLLAAGVTWVVPAWSADVAVVIRATALEPHVLSAVAGQRVNFVKRVDRPVHVEFGVDPSAHQVFQMPATGPIWAVFHRPGTHPYVVHIYGRKTTVLHGVVEVVEDPERPWGPGTCGAVVLEVCIEP
jgi:plastocyanin